LSESEKKKKPYQKPVLLDFGEGSRARSRLLLWAISNGISKAEVEDLLEELDRLSAMCEEKKPRPD